MSVARKKVGSLEMRLSNLTVRALRNFCDVKGIQGTSGLKKSALIKRVILEAEPADLDDFVSASEGDYLMDNFRKAVKWGKSELLVHIGEGANEREMHAEFNGLDVGLRRVYYVDFYAVSDARKIQTSCECVDSRKRGLFCAHQMAVLLRGLEEKKLRLSRWKGPMTAELRSSIMALFPKARK